MLGYGGSGQCRLSPLSIPMLDMMSRNRIFSIERIGSEFSICECCDNNFEAILNADELRSLGQEIIALANASNDREATEPAEDSPEALKADIATLYEITCDQANEITQNRVLLRRWVDLDGERDDVAALIAETRSEIDV